LASFLSEVAVFEESFNSLPLTFDELHSLWQLPVRVFLGRTFRSFRSFFIQY
jgi:hypothetical protein